MPSRDAVEIRPAATILLLRDGAAGLEVFMVERHHQIDFAKGALVFPGGRVEPGDSDPALRERCPGSDSLEERVLALQVAAIRETFEECGVLLARPAGSDQLVDADRVAGIRKRYSEELRRQSVPIGPLAASEDLELACDQLVHFAHWITPPVMPKRFDTHFFLVTAPGDHLALHDGIESVDSLWTTAKEALASQRDGRRTIIFPTRMQLEKLSRSANVEHALGAALESPVVTVLPEVRRGEDGVPQLHIPEAAGYDFVSGPVDEMTR